MKEQILSESLTLRKKICGDLGENLLYQCGKIQFLSETRLAIKTAICQYYGVPMGTLDWLIQRHRRELREFGYKVLAKKDFKNLDDPSFKIPTRGLAVFPPAAILCIGMHLRDSETARNLRMAIWESFSQMGKEILDEEILLESMSLRDSYATESNLSILDLVGLLATLPDTAWSTVEQVAEYYRVGIEAIESIILRHRAELESDGFKILTKKELANLQLEGFINATTSRLAIFTRRAILRVGMLLRDSKVAKEVRSYLLHAESQAPWRQGKSLHPVPSQTPDFAKQLQDFREEFQKEQSENTRRYKAQQAKSDELYRRMERWESSQDALKQKMEELDSSQRKSISFQEELRKEIRAMRQEQEKRLIRLEEDFHFLLWNKKEEPSPISQILHRIRVLEEKIFDISMDGKIRKLQIGIIYGDVIDLREYVEKEIEKGRQGSKEVAGRLFQQEDKLSRIGQEIKKLEQKISAMLKEKKPSPPKTLTPSLSPGPRISKEQAKALKREAEKRCQGNRKKIMALWRAFKEAFGISRYKHLPASRFDEALEWVGNWEVMRG